MSDARVRTLYWYFAAKDDDHDIDYDDEDGGKNKPPSLFGPCDLSTLQEGQHKGEQHGLLHNSEESDQKSIRAEHLTYTIQKVSDSGLNSQHKSGQLQKTKQYKANTKDTIQYKTQTKTKVYAENTKRTSFAQLFRLVPPQLGKQHLD